MAEVGTTQDAGNVSEQDTRVSVAYQPIPRSNDDIANIRRVNSRDAVGERIYQFAGFSEILSGIKSIQLEKYNMNHKRRGLALIFNQENFDSCTGMNKRTGTDKDVINLRKYLSKLGFESLVYQDLTRREMESMLLQAARADHTDSDCLLCSFLTHGDDGVIFGRDGTIEIQGLFEIFRGENCPSLVGKPKIFLIQACRGEKHEIGVIPPEDETDAGSALVTTVTNGLPLTIPAGADFLLSYSVTDGFYSHRDTAYGSWYVQALSRVLDAYGTTTDFTQILTMVNQLVAQRAVERCLDARMIGKKQIPCFVSMLTKQLIFTPKS